MADRPTDGKAPLLQRLGWMGAIWLASVCVLGIVAYAIKAWLIP